MIITKGITPLAISDIFAFPIACSTYILSPTGGVIKAHSIISVKIIPNQIKSIFFAAIEIENMGIIIKINDRVSIIKPKINKVIATTNINIPCSVIFVTIKAESS